MKRWKGLLAGLLAAMMLAGCGEIAEEAAGAALSVAEYELAQEAATETYTEEEESAVAASTEADAVDPDFTIDAEEEADSELGKGSGADTLVTGPGPQVSTKDDKEAQNPALVTESGPQTETLDEDGYYYDKDNVALYLVTYHKLPSNYITKKEAKALGWEGGALEPYAPDMAIGGDHFGNYEGILPEDAEYHECDIDTKGKKRGAKRIIYSDDWDIYYTDDHYETFELLYEGE